MHRITEKRFTGVAGRNFRMLRDLCGDPALEGVVLVTNMWGEIPQEDGEELEEQLISKYFKPALDKGASLARHLNTVESAHDIIRGIMRKRLQVPLQIQREIVEEGMGVRDTAAGEAINEELNDQIRRHRAEMATMEEDMERALEERDDEMRWEREEEMQRLQYHVDETRADLETMTSRYEEEREWMDYEMRREQEKKDKRRRKRKRFWTAAAVIGTVLLL